MVNRSLVSLVLVMASCLPATTTGSYERPHGLNPTLLIVNEGVRDYIIEDARTGRVFSIRGSGRRCYTMDPGVTRLRLSYVRQPRPGRDPIEYTPTIRFNTDYGPRVSPEANWVLRLGFTRGLGNDAINIQPGPRCGR